MKRLLMMCLIAAAACSRKPETAIATPALQPAHPPATAAVPSTASPSAAAALSAAASSLSGNVVETMDAGGYTYLRVHTASGDEWAAVPQTAIKPGAEVTVEVQMTAQNFESKTLKRTFDKVLFGTIAGTPGATSLPPNHPALGASLLPNHPPIASASTAAPAAADVSVAPPAGGKSIAQVWSERAALKDSQVVVRGKVVKFLPGIMGKNWMHLRDGSGSPANGDNDLTVTTMDTAAAGDVVTIKGVVHTNKDFGAGYSYKVIVEDARVVK
jgi:hypothetical protein